MTEQNKATDQEFLFIALGASKELTHAVSLASDLRKAIGNMDNNANDYALKKVQTELSKRPACKGKNCRATDGVSHSIECFREHDECYREDNIDRAAKRNHVMLHGSEYYVPNTIYTTKDV